MSDESRQTAAELSRLGAEILKLKVQPALGPEDDGKFVAVDVETGDYEINENDYAAVSRLRNRRPEADIWLGRVGESAAYGIRGYNGRLAPSYERLKDDEYDDSPWTREELQALVWEAGKQLGWKDMDEYDDEDDRMIRAVIFDFNGVLLDDESLHFEMFREQLAGEGVTITSDDYHQRYLGLDDRACFEAALTDAGQTATSQRLDDLIERKAVRYAEEAARGLTFFPGAAECLAALAERYPLAINSGALRPEIVFGLEEIGCRDHVAVIVSAEEVERCKPHPEGYTLALTGLRKFEETLGVSSKLTPSQCLVIEDSLAGIESAKGAGMWAVGVPNTYTREELLESGADDVVDDLASFTPSWIAERFTARV